MGCDAKSPYWIKRERILRNEKDRQSVRVESGADYKIVMPSAFSSNNYKYAESKITKTPSGNLVERIYFFISPHNDGDPKGSMEIYYMTLNDEVAPRMYVAGIKWREPRGNYEDVIKNGKYVDKNIKTIPAYEIKFKTEGGSINIDYEENVNPEIVLTKCKFDDNIQRVNNVSDKELNDLIVQQPDNKRFKIKDLIIGETLENKCDEIASKQEYNNKTLQYCKFETTVFEVPFNVYTTLLNGKIMRVVFVAKKFPAPNTHTLGTNPLYDSIKIADMSSFSNNLISRISETLGQPKIDKRREGLPQSTQYRANENTSKLKKACGVCNVDHFAVTWDGAHSVVLNASVPEFIESPGVLKHMTFEYSMPNLNKYLNDYVNEKMNARLNDEKRVHEKFLSLMKSQKQEVENRKSKDI